MQPGTKNTPDHSFSAARNASRCFFNSLITNGIVRGYGPYGGVVNDPAYRLNKENKHENFTNDLIIRLVNKSKRSKPLYRKKCFELGNSLDTSNASSSVAMRKVNG